MRCLSFFINKKNWGKKLCVGTCLKYLTVATPLTDTCTDSDNIRLFCYTGEVKRETDTCTDSDPIGMFCYNGHIQRMTECDPIGLFCYTCYIQIVTNSNTYDFSVTQMIYVG